MRRPSHLIRRIDFQLEPKPASAAVTVKPHKQARLILLDRRGRMKLLFLEKLPDPAILTHHVRPLLAD